MIEKRYGESAPWSVGVEEELMIVDRETLEQAPGVAALVGGAERLDLPGRMKTELFASVVELNTGICSSVEDAVDAVAALRVAAAELAERNGLLVAAAGSHPTSAAEEQEVVPEERYVEFVEYAGVSARRQGVQGLHVHVGMPDAKTCFDALERVLPWLPLVLALSANSPYLDGRESGLASARAEILALLPRSGAPPALGSHEGFESFVERLQAAGVVKEYTQIWWDARPHPRFGTLEIRMPDQPTRLHLTAAFAALLQALCVWAAEERPAGTADRGIYAENRWAALRFGPRARLVHPLGGGAATVPELAAELLDRLGETLRRLRTVDLVAALVAEACEGDRQLEIGRARGLRAVTEELVDRTLRSAEEWSSGRR